MKKQNLIKLTCAGAFVALGFNAFGQVGPDTIYSTFGSENAAAGYPALVNGQEFGNQVQLIGQYANVWDLQDFQIAYYAPTSDSYSALQNVGLDVSIYANNGPAYGVGNQPGTLLWTSGFYYGTAGLGLTQGLNGGGLYTIEYGDGDTYYPDSAQTINGNLPGYGLSLPSSFTFTVQFTGLDANGDNLIELPVANSFTNSTSVNFGNYWVKNGGWTLSASTNSAGALVQGNLLVSLTGVPEPSVFYLGALGSAMLLGFNRFKRKH